jgi:hypothetical protein
MSHADCTLSGEDFSTKPHFDTNRGLVDGTCRAIQPPDRPQGMPFWAFQCRPTVPVHYSPASRATASIDLANAADIAAVLFSTGNETMITLLCSTPISVSA